MEHMIRKYINDNRTGKPCGMLAAAKINGLVYVTATRARVSKGDRFCKKTGNQIAIDRLICMSNGRHSKIPASFAEHVQPFLERCEKYYETDRIVIPDVGTFQK